MDANRRNGGPQHLSNKRVCFWIRDVFVPGPCRILAEVPGLDLLDGRVVGLSDNGARRGAGAKRGAFAVVEVECLRGAVVVPVAKIVDLEH